MSKKWLNATFLSFTGFASRIRSRAAKPAKNENLWVFIRSDAHVVRAGLNIRGCGPLSTPGFFDRLKYRLCPYGRVRQNFFIITPAYIELIVRRIYTLGIINKEVLTMPHIDITMYPGRSEELKAELAKN
ncbi:MAG: hypothetical protein SPE28_07175, partial [Eubacteriales bacterium]|nr:hypothetical protein [Eubacteriales bacterium]